MAGVLDNALAVNEKQPGVVARLVHNFVHHVAEKVGNWGSGKEAHYSQETANGGRVSVLTHKGDSGLTNAADVMVQFPNGVEVTMHLPRGPVDAEGRGTVKQHGETTAIDEKCSGPGKVEALSPETTAQIWRAVKGVEISGGINDARAVELGELASTALCGPIGQQPSNGRH